MELTAQRPHKKDTVIQGKILNFNKAVQVMPKWDCKMERLDGLIINILDRNDLHK